MRCKICLAENPEGQAYCVKCGADLRDSRPSAAEDLDAFAVDVARFKEGAQHWALEEGRPLGISILSVLHGIGGLGILVVTFAVRPTAGFEEVLARLETSVWVAYASFLFLACLAMGSAVGMWLGKKWGWWLATFYYVHSILRNSGALLMVAALADEWASDARGPGYYFFKHAGRIAINVLILTYCFRRRVLHFFHLDNLSKAKALGALFGAALAIGVLGAILGALTA